MSSPTTFLSIIAILRTHCGSSVLLNQISWFGPIPAGYASLLEDEDRSWSILGEVIHRIDRDNKWKPFAMVEDFTDEEKRFLCKIMRLDPRHRPTARDLLQDEWLKVCDRLWYFLNDSSAAEQLPAI